MCQPNCGKCGVCKSEKSNLCTAAPGRFVGMPRDGSSRFTDRTGSSLNNLFGISSFSEYTVVDVASIVKLDPAMPTAQACILSCGVSTGLGSALKVANVEEGSTVAIFGLGGVGLAVAEGARLRGAAKIIGIDLNPKKFLIGKKFGITEFINPNEIGENSVNEIIKQMTDGGADYCFDCIGISPTMNEAFKSSKTGGGMTIIIGADFECSSMPLKSLDIIYGKTIIGSIVGRVKIKVDVPIFVKKYLDKEIHLDEFITHEVNFSEINKAIELLINGDAVKCIIHMNN